MTNYIKAVADTARKYSRAAQSNLPEDEDSDTQQSEDLSAVENISRSLAPRNDDGQQKSTIEIQFEEMKELMHSRCSSDQLYVDRMMDRSLVKVMTLGELQSTVPFLNWTRYVNNHISDPRKKVDSNEKVVVWLPNFLDELNGVLVGNTQRDVANYLMWRWAES